MNKLTDLIQDLSLKDNELCIPSIIITGPEEKSEKKISRLQIENELWKDVKCIFSKNLTFTKHGSISYLLYGIQLSSQSIMIKIGKLGELIPKKIIEKSFNFELMRWWSSIY